MLAYGKRDKMQLNILALELHMTKEKEELYHPLTTEQLLSMNDQILEGQVTSAYDMYLEYVTNGESDKYIRRRRSYFNYLTTQGLHLKHITKTVLTARSKSKSIEFDDKNKIRNEVVKLFKSTNCEIQIKFKLREILVYYYTSDIYLYYRFIRTDIGEGKMHTEGKCNCCRFELPVLHVEYNSRYIKNKRFNPICLINLGLNFTLNNDLHSDYIVNHFYENDLELNINNLTEFVQDIERKEKSLS